MNTPKYTKPAGDNLKGKEVKAAGIELRLPSGMASDLVKLILYPENLLNRSIMLSRAGIDVSGWI